jgi:hypothetical protein
VEHVLLFELLLEGTVGDLPPTEVMQLAPDLLAPVTGRVGGEREVGIGLVGLDALRGLACRGSLGRMKFGNGDSP